MRKISILLGLILLTSTLFCISTYGTQTDDSQTITIDDLAGYEQLLGGGQSQEELKKEYEKNLKDISDYYDSYTRPDTVRAKVIQAGKEQIEYKSDNYYGVYEEKYQEMKIRILEGQFKDKEIDTRYMLSSDSLGNIKIPKIAVGNVVPVVITPNDSGTEVASADIISTDISVERIGWIIVLVVLTLILLFIYTDIKKLSMIIPIIVFVDLIFVVMMPLVLKGVSSILIASAIAIIMIFLNSTLRVGLNKINIVATIGAVLAASVTLLLTLSFGGLLKFSGSTIEAAQLAEIITKRNINLYELSISMIILASSIVCSDVACKVAKKIHEEKKDAQMLSRILSDSKGIIASRLNIIAVLIISFTLPKYLLLLLFKYSTYDILNSEILFTDITRALLLMIALIISVPLTTIIGRLLYKKEEISQINVQE
jgi:uncharacterized membrane protein